jgi:hypothetical protein
MTFFDSMPNAVICCAAVINACRGNGDVLANAVISSIMPLAASALPSSVVNAAFAFWLSVLNSTPVLNTDAVVPASAAAAGSPPERGSRLPADEAALPSPESADVAADVVASTMMRNVSCCHRARHLPLRSGGRFHPFGCLDHEPDVSPRGVLDDRERHPVEVSDFREF